MFFTLVMAHDKSLHATFAGGIATLPKAPFCARIFVIVPFVPPESPGT